MHLAAIEGCVKRCLIYRLSFSHFFAFVVVFLFGGRVRRTPTWSPLRAASASSWNAGPWKGGAIVLVPTAHTLRPVPLSLLHASFVSNARPIWPPLQIQTWIQEQQELSIVLFATFFFFTFIAFSIPAWRELCLYSSDESYESEGSPLEEARFGPQRYLSGSVCSRFKANRRRTLRFATGVDERLEDGILCVRPAAFVRVKQSQLAGGLRRRTSVSMQVPLVLLLSCALLCR